ncbi:MAG: flagellar hook-basal body protein [Bacillota bacterium]|nr:flagellar hook-basal body complex protein [Candidatus Fermentithermobacillaceae bacterium]
MIRGILSAATAMRAQVLNQEVIANNLANTDTVAYQKDKVVFQSFHDALMYRFDNLSQAAIGGYSSGTVLHDIATMDTVGGLETTQRPLDIALPQGTYLAVETPAGTRYTRMGNLKDEDGYLTVGGYRVLGTNSAIALESGKVYSISDDGAVFADDETVDKLSVFSFSGDYELEKEGNGLFRLTGGNATPIESPRVLVGVLEKSTVDPVSEMVALISAMRVYEAAQRALRSHDETLEQAVNRVGRV